jgi:hypothetical protein
MTFPPKRDDLSAYEQRFGERPGLPSGALIIWPEMASVGCPVVRFFQIVKTAHSRARTERTLVYGVDFGSPRAQECCGQA